MRYTCVEPMNFQQLLSQPRNFRFAILATLLLAIVLRLPNLNESFWLDEAAQALESTRPLSEQLNIPEDFQPPLYHLVVFAFAQISHAEWWMRLASLIPGLISIWVMMIIGERLGGKRVGLLTGLLLATHSFHIFYSQELRPYMLAAMFAAISWWGILNASVKSTSDSSTVLGMTRRHSWLIYTLATIGGLYSSYLYSFFVLGQAGWWFLGQKFNRTKLIWMIKAWIVSAISFIPWLPYFATQLQVSSELRQAFPTWEEVVSSSQLDALPLTIGKMIFGVLDLEINLIFIGTTLMVLFLMIMILVNNSLISINLKKWNDKVLKLFLWWGIAPVLATWIFSFILPVIQAKRVLFSFPVWSLLLAYLIAIGFRQTKLRRYAVALCILILTIQISATTLSFIGVKYQREPWREVIQQIERQYDPSDTAVVFGFTHEFSPWAWYATEDFPIYVSGGATVTSTDQLDSRLKFSLDQPRVLIFDYLLDVTDPHRFIHQWYRQYNYQPVGTINGANLGFVRVYEQGGLFAQQ